MCMGRDSPCAACVRPDVYERDLVVACAQEHVRCGRKDASHPPRLHPLDPTTMGLPQNEGGKGVGGGRGVQHAHPPVVRAHAQLRPLRVPCDAGGPVAARAEVRYPARLLGRRRKPGEKERGEREREKERERERERGKEKRGGCGQLLVRRMRVLGGGAGHGGVVVARTGLTTMSGVADIAASSGARRGGEGSGTARPKWMSRVVRAATAAPGLPM